PNDAAKPAAKPVTTGTNKSVKDPEAERIAKERRDNAQALLISLAADAGRFNDQTLRARTQARIADVLWSADPDRARAMFRKAWESAEIVDQEAQRKLQEEIAQQKAKNGGDGAAADQRYAALLAMATNNLQSDANTVSLLGSYIFTPHTFVTFDNNGSSVSSSGRNNGPPAIPPTLRNAFFNTAAEILLRPMAPPGQNQSTTGVKGKYLMLKRLLPLFEQY